LFFDPQVQLHQTVNATRASSLDELLRQSDIISLHVPLTSENRSFIDAGALERVKPGAVLINTARGGLIDEAALAGALRDGRLSGAALDVLQKEPPNPDNPLLQMDNVLITPHIAAGTRDALQAKMCAAFANMQRRLAGEPLWHLVPELADLFEGAD
jgi:D-3-phosphoglycerate dehydrogenase